MLQAFVRKAWSLRLPPDQWTNEAKDVIRLAKLQRSAEVATEDLCGTGGT